MSTKYKFHDPEGIYFISFAVVEWIDVFSRSVYKNILVDSLIYCQTHKGLIIYAWVIMSNHVHLIIATEGDELSGIVRDLKKYSSSRIIKEIQNNPLESRKHWMLKIFKEHGRKNSNNTHYQFWRQDNQAKLLLPYENSFMIQKLNYLHQNPVKAQVVDTPEAYIYSSARCYAGQKGLIDVTLLE